MTCAIALTAVLFFTIDPASSVPATSAAQPAPIGASLLSAEEDFAALVQEALRLKNIVDGWRAQEVISDAGFWVTPAYRQFKADAGALAAANLKAHLELKERGTDGDLTCILRGISEDMPLKIDQLETSATGNARRQALEDLAYLLNDNAEVILAPPVRP